MPELMPKVPQTWTPLHSVAYLLHCVAMADGELDGEEIIATERLVAHYGQVTEEQSHDACVLAFQFLRHVISERGREGYLGSVREHAARLANHYGPSVLRSVVSDMLRVAQADGVLEDSEVFVIQGVAADWAVQDDA